MRERVREEEELERRKRQSEKHRLGRDREEEEPERRKSQRGGRPQGVYSFCWMMAQ